MATRFQDFKFQTKVLLAVVGVMVLLVAATMFMVNRRLNQQLQGDTEQALRTAESVFRNSQNIRGRNLLLRFRNIAQEPRYRAACQQQDPVTLNELLKPLVSRDLGGDIVQYKNNEGSVISAVRKSQDIDLSEFSRNSEQSTLLARELGDPPPLVVRVGNSLFDVISVPVMMPLDKEIIGTLTFAVQLDDLEAREFQQITGSDIVLLADRVVVSSPGLPPSPMRKNPADCSKALPMHQGRPCFFISPCRSRRVMSRPTA